MRPGFQILSGVCLIVLGTLYGREAFEDGIYFLFMPEKAYVINSERAYTQHELSMMQNGVWALGIVISGLIIFAMAVWSIVRARISDRGTQIQ